MSLISGGPTSRDLHRASVAQIRRLCCSLARPITASATCAVCDESVTPQGTRRDVCVTLRNSCRLCRVSCLESFPCSAKLPGSVTFV
eukprot:1182685-Prorocentrum_minimum.AAC.1